MTLFINFRWLVNLWIISRLLSFLAHGDPVSVASRAHAVVASIEIYSWDVLRHYVEEVGGTSLSFILMADIKIGAGLHSGVEGMFIGSSQQVTLRSDGRRKALVGDGCHRAFKVAGSLEIRGVDILNTGICGNASDARGGGAVYVAEGANLILQNVRIFNSTNRIGPGGAIFTDGFTVTRWNTTLEENEAEGVGGAVFVSSTGSFWSSDTRFKNNAARQGGNMLYVDQQGRYLASCDRRKVEVLPTSACTGCGANEIYSCGECLSGYYDSAGFSGFCEAVLAGATPTYAPPPSISFRALASDSQTSTSTTTSTASASAASSTTTSTTSTSATTMTNTVSTATTTATTSSAAAALITGPSSGISIEVWIGSGLFLGMCFAAIGGLFWWRRHRRSKRSRDPGPSTSPFASDTYLDTDSAEPRSVTNNAVALEMLDSASPSAASQPEPPPEHTVKPPPEHTVKPPPGSTVYDRPPKPKGPPKPDGDDADAGAEAVTRAAGVIVDDGISPLAAGAVEPAPEHTVLPPPDSTKFDRPPPHPIAMSESREFVSMSSDYAMSIHEPGHASPAAPFGSSMFEGSPDSNSAVAASPSRAPQRERRISASPRFGGEILIHLDSEDPGDWAAPELGPAPDYTLQPPTGSTKFERPTPGAKREEDRGAKPLSSVVDLDDPLDSTRHVTTMFASSRTGDEAVDVEEGRAGSRVMMFERSEAEDNAAIAPRSGSRVMMFERSEEVHNGATSEGDFGALISVPSTFSLRFFSEIGETVASYLEEMAEYAFPLEPAGPARWEASEMSRSEAATEGRPVVSLDDDDDDVRPISTSPHLRTGSTTTTIISHDTIELSSNARPWHLELVDHDSLEWSVLSRILENKAGNLGRQTERVFGRVPRNIRDLDGYSKLVPVAAWKVDARLRFQKYKLELQELRKKMLSVQRQRGFERMPPLRTKMDRASTELGMQGLAEERLLLFGTPAEEVATILENGLVARLGGQVGIVLAEDAATMDQYATPDDLGSPSMKVLHDELYTSHGLVHPGEQGKVYYGFVCRTILGFSLFTKDSKVTSTSMEARIRSPPGLAIFHDHRRRELRSIPKVKPMTPFQSLVVEAGPSEDGYLLTRSREFVVIHPLQVYPEYLVAYRRE